LKPDLEFEVIEPRFITIGNQNISLKRIKDFLSGYYHVSTVANAPEISELVEILKAAGISHLKDSLPHRACQRQFLKDNVELFKLLWDVRNYT
jgi:hypothetical protein